MQIMTTWGTADWHFGHARIIEYEYRPWASVEEMNEAIIENLQVVQPTDDLWIIGDAFMVKQPRINIPLLMAQIPGRKHLISGNHDPSFPGRKSWQAWKRWMVDEGGFTHVFDHHVKMSLSDHLVTMCHFPYDGDHTSEERYVENRPLDQGDWLLHGHVHGAWKQRLKMINLGIDVWDYKPVNLEQVIELIKAGPVPDSLVQPV